MRRHNSAPISRLLRKRLRPVSVYTNNGADTMLMLGASSVGSSELSLLCTPSMSYHHRQQQQEHLRMHDRPRSPPRDHHDRKHERERKSSPGDKDTNTSNRGGGRESGDLYNERGTNNNNNNNNNNFKNRHNTDRGDRTRFDSATRRDDGWRRGNSAAPPQGRRSVTHKEDDGTLRREHNDLDRHLEQNNRNVERSESNRTKKRDNVDSHNKERKVETPKTCPRESPKGEEEQGERKQREEKKAAPAPAAPRVPRRGGATLAPTSQQHSRRAGSTTLTSSSSSAVGHGPSPPSLSLAASRGNNSKETNDNDNNKAVRMKSDEMMVGQGLSYPSYSNKGGNKHQYQRDSSFSPHHNAFASSAAVLVHSVNVAVPADHHQLQTARMNAAKGSKEQEKEEESTTAKHNRVPEDSLLRDNRADLGPRRRTNQPHQHQHHLFDRSSSSSAAPASSLSLLSQSSAAIPTTRISRWSAALKTFTNAPISSRTPALAFSTLETFRQAIVAAEYDEHKALRYTMRKKYGNHPFEERYVGEEAMKSRVAAQFALDISSSAAATVASSGGDTDKVTKEIDRATASADGDGFHTANRREGEGADDEDSSTDKAAGKGRAVGGGSHVSKHAMSQLESRVGISKSNRAHNNNNNKSSSSSPEKAGQHGLDHKNADDELAAVLSESSDMLTHTNDNTSPTMDNAAMNAKGGDVVDTDIAAATTTGDNPATAHRHPQKNKSSKRIGNYSDWDDGDELLEYDPNTSALLDAFASFRLAAVSEEYGLTPFEQSELYKRAILILVESEDKAMARTNLRATGDKSTCSDSNNNNNNDTTKTKYDRTHTDNLVNTKDNQLPFVGDFSIDSAGDASESHKALVRRQRLPPTSFVLQAIACLSEAKLLNIPLTVGHYLPILKCPLVAEIDKDLPMRLLADAATAVADTYEQSGREEPEELAAKAIFRAQVAAAGTYAITGNWQQALLLCRTDPTFAALVKSLVESNLWPWAYYLVNQVTSANKEQYLRSVSIAEAYSATARAAVEYGMRVTFANANPVAQKMNTSNRTTARIDGVTEGFSALGGPVGETRKALLNQIGGVEQATSRSSSSSIGHANASGNGDFLNDDAELSGKGFGFSSSSTPKRAVVESETAAPTFRNSRSPQQPIDPQAIKLYLDFSDPAACAYAVENSTKYAENQVAPYNCLPPKEVDDLFNHWLGLTREWIAANASSASGQRGGTWCERSNQDQNSNMSINDDADADADDDSSREGTIGDGNASTCIYLHTPKHLTRQVIEPLILSAPPGRVLDALSLFPHFAEHYHRHVRELDMKVERLKNEAEGAGLSDDYENRFARGGQALRNELRRRERELQKAESKRGEVVAGEVIPLGVIIRSLHRSCEWRTIIKFYCDTALGIGRQMSSSSFSYSSPLNETGVEEGSPLAIKRGLIDRFREILSSEEKKSGVRLHHDLIALLTDGKFGSAANSDENSDLSSRRLPLRPNIFNGYEWHPADEAHILLSIGQAILCSSGDAPDLSLSSQPQAVKESVRCAIADGDGGLPHTLSRVHSELDRRLQELLGEDHETILPYSSTLNQKEGRSNAKFDSATETQPTTTSSTQVDTKKQSPHFFTPADAIAFSALLPDTNSHKHMALLHILSRGGKGCPAGTHWDVCEKALVFTDAMSNIFIDLFVWQMTAAGYFVKANESFEDFMRRRKRRAVQLGSHNQHPRWPIFSYLMLSTSALRASGGYQKPIRDYLLENSSLVGATPSAAKPPTKANVTPSSVTAEALLRLIEIGSPRVDPWAVMHAISCLICSVVEVPTIPTKLIAEEKAHYERQLRAWQRVAEEEGGMQREGGGEGAFGGDQLNEAKEGGDAGVLSLLGSTSQQRSQAHRDKTTMRRSPSSSGSGSFFSSSSSSPPLALPPRPVERPITYRRVRKYMERQAFLQQEELSLLSDSKNANAGAFSRLPADGGFAGRSEKWSGNQTAVSQSAAASSSCLVNEHILRLLELFRSGKLDAIRPRTQTEYNNLSLFFVKQVYAVIKYYSEVDHRDPCEQLTAYVHNHDDLRMKHMGLLRRFQHEMPSAELEIAPTVRERVQYRLDGSACVIVAIIKELAKRTGNNNIRSAGNNNNNNNGSTINHHRGGDRSSFSTANVISAAVRQGIPLPIDELID